MDNLQRNLIAKKFQNALFKASDSQIAKDYLNKRKIPVSVAKRFLIGWCPENAKNVPINIEKLKGRVIFPIINEYGDVVAFSGRIPKEGEKGSETELRWWHEKYNKSFYPYGMNIAYKSMFEKDYVIVVEGQTDVIACHKFGFKNTIGVMGTSLTNDAIAKIIRFTRKFVLLFDGDKSGRNAAKRTKEFLLKHKDYEVIDVPLIYKKVPYDPDNFLNRFGSLKIKEYIEKKGIKL